MRPIPKRFVAVVLVGCFLTAVAVAEEPECEGPYNGRRLTPEELVAVLRSHQACLESGRKPDDERKANLCRADLDTANLQKAQLPYANLQEAFLLGANLQGAVFEPKLGTLPNFWTLTNPNNHLETLVFHDSPAALTALREDFKKGGMRTQERQLTYAIEHSKQLQAWDPSWHILTEGDTRPWLAHLAGKSESLFSYVLFELPSGYGMVPSRALATLGLLILVFSLAYMVALLTARGRAGIWVTWPTDRVYQEEGVKEATRVTNTFFFPRWQARAAGRWWGVLLRGVSVPLIGLYFSLLSAFSLGWRELNVGTWIARMQPREYTLRATGWVRTVSGIQSLFSVYLLALWVLTPHGTPDHDCRFSLHLGGGDTTRALPRFPYLYKRPQPIREWSR